MDIQGLEPSEPVTVVGVEQTIDDSMQPQLEVLQSKAEAWGKKVRDGFIPCKLAWTGFCTMLWPALRYPLPATTFTEQEGEEITKQLYKSILPTLGAARTFPLVYRFAPECLQGFGLPHVYVEQEIAHISNLLVHGAIGTLQGDMMTANLEQAQLEVGIRIRLFKASFEHFGFLLTDCLVKSLWKFVSEFGIVLHLPEYLVPELQRENDFFLIE